MAEKRMFSNKVVSTDNFYDLSDPAQVLYFHLCMSADDDGMIANWRSILRVIDKKQDDLKELINKGFVLAFTSGVIAIIHWTINNSLRKDRKKDTIYQQEFEKLEKYIEDKDCLEIGNISLLQPSVNHVEPECLGSIDKVSIEEYIVPLPEPKCVSIDKDKKNKPKKTTKANTKNKEIAKEIFKHWNSKEIVVHRKLDDLSISGINKLLTDYDKEEIMNMIDRYNQVLKDDSYYFEYKWSLRDFVNRKNGAPDFAIDGSKWVNYCESAKIDNDSTTFEKTEGKTTKHGDGVFQL